MFNFKQKLSHTHTYTHTFINACNMYPCLHTVRFETFGKLLNISYHLTTRKFIARVYLQRLRLKKKKKTVHMFVQVMNFF